MSGINFNPLPTTVGQGLFEGARSTGLIQGTAFPDGDGPSWFANAQGVIDASETIPMWGGVGVYADVPGGAGNPNFSLGLRIGRATSLTGSKALAGFTVFDRAYNFVNTPQSPVPTGLPGMSAMYYLLGSGARIAVACDPILVDLRGTPISSQVSWDFTGQMLVPYSGAYSDTTISNAVWANTAGGEITFTVGTDLSGDLTAGDQIEVTGVVNTGGSSTSAFNGAWPVVSADSTHVVVAAPAASSIGTYSSGGKVVGAGGALPVKVLDVQQTNCMTVEYDGSFATWDYDGSCAVIQL